MLKGSKLRGVFDTGYDLATQGDQMSFTGVRRNQCLTYIIVCSIKIDRRIQLLESIAEVVDL